MTEHTVRMATTSDAPAATAVDRRVPDDAAARLRGTDAAIAVGLVVVYALAQSRSVVPPVLSDQLHYLVDAATLPEITGPFHQTLRIGLVLPVSALIGLTGYSELAYYGVGYLSVAVLVVAVFVLGRVLFGRAVGVGAALLMIANPHVLEHGSQLLPDLPATALVTVAVGAMIMAAQPTRTRRTRDLLLLAAGALLGWAYLVRELIGVVLPAAPVLLVVLGLRRRALLRVAVPAATMVGVELAWGALFHGDPFARMRAAASHTGALPWQAEAGSDYPESVAALLTEMPRAVLADRSGWLLLVLLVMLLAALATTRRRPFAAVTAWFAVPLLVLLLLNVVTF
jgi:4-amino-4-deoxy-L-arabinose transferase-like glycosyltransferase